MKRVSSLVVLRYIDGFSRFPSRVLKGLFSNKTAHRSVLRWQEQEHLCKGKSMLCWLVSGCLSSLSISSFLVRKQILILPLIIREVVLTSSPASVMWTVKSAGARGGAVPSSGFMLIFFTTFSLTCCFLLFPPFEFFLASLSSEPGASFSSSGICFIYSKLSCQLHFRLIC